MGTHTGGLPLINRGERFKGKLGFRVPAALAFGIYGRVLPVFRVQRGDFGI